MMIRFFIAAGTVRKIILHSPSLSSGCSNYVRNMFVRSERRNFPRIRNR